MNKILSSGTSLAFLAKSCVSFQSLQTWTQIRSASKWIPISANVSGASTTRITSGRPCNEPGSVAGRQGYLSATRPITNTIRSLSFSGLFSPVQAKLNLTNNLCAPPPSPMMEVTRTVTKFSLLKGRRKTQSAVKKRFFRLDWGGWISTIPGRARHLWKKSAQQRTYLRNHVLRNAAEVRLLEKMVTKYWVKKKYYVDDPYESYHNRDNFRITKGVKGIASTRLFRPQRYVGRERYKRLTDV